ncbi:MAG: hypothetical protein RMJ48_12505 [Roseiflexaceae bacterium]|nr:hypothetical protein [Roseiflexaceae bacterium]
MQRPVAVGDQDDFIDATALIEEIAQKLAAFHSPQLVTAEAHPSMPTVLERRSSGRSQRIR